MQTETYWPLPEQRRSGVYTDERPASTGRSKHTREVGTVARARPCCCPWRMWPGMHVAAPGGPGRKTEPCDSLRVYGGRRQLVKPAAQGTPDTSPCGPQAREGAQPPTRRPSRCCRRPDRALGRLCSTTARRWLSRPFGSGSSPPSTSSCLPLELNSAPLTCWRKHPARVVPHPCEPARLHPAQALASFGVGLNPGDAIQTVEPVRDGGEFQGTRARSTARSISFNLGMSRSSRPGLRLGAQAPGA